MYTQKYCIVHFLEAVEKGAQFSMSAWPLHVTLADVFAVPIPIAELNKELTQVLSSGTSADTVAIKEAELSTTPVVLLERTHSLLSLHDKIIKLLKESGAQFNMPDFVEEGFLPHCTIQGTQKLPIGSEVNINSAALVDMFPGKDWKQRKVLEVFKIPS